MTKVVALILSVYMKLSAILPGTGIFFRSLQLCKPGPCSQNTTHYPTHTYAHHSPFPTKGHDGHNPPKIWAYFHKTNSSRILPSPSGNSLSTFFFKFHCCFHSSPLLRMYTTLVLMHASFPPSPLTPI